MSKMALVLGALAVAIVGLVAVALSRDDTSTLTEQFPGVYLRAAGLTVDEATEIPCASDMSPAVGGLMTPTSSTEQSQIDSIAERYGIAYDSSIKRPHPRSSESVITTLTSSQTAVAEFVMKDVSETGESPQWMTTAIQVCAE